ncbi:DUF4194 domain-containing protein [Corynebacterium sp.]|uniref:DUF4194 domain-containing protein n=1 Tax=Corynebacterium sp. TaxID=1720 RepID=UPI0034C6D775
MKSKPREDTESEVQLIVTSQQKQSLLNPELDQESLSSGNDVFTPTEQAMKDKNTPQSSSTSDKMTTENPDSAVISEHNPDESEEHYGGLWPGDCGTLSFDSRRAFAQLLQGPLIRANQHPQVWKAITSDEAAIRSRLADVFLDLVLDVDSGIAFTRSAHNGQPIAISNNNQIEMPKILRSKTLTIIDTVILLDLRTQVGLAAPGERVIVAEEDLRENASLFRRVEDLDEASFKRRFDASLKRMHTDFSLLNTTETEGRFEVSPVLKHLFDAQTVEGIKTEFEQLLKEDTHER